MHVCMCVCVCVCVYCMYVCMCVCVWTTASRQASLSIFAGIFCKVLHWLCSADVGVFAQFGHRVSRPQAREHSHWSQWISSLYRFRYHKLPSPSSPSPSPIVSFHHPHADFSRHYHWIWWCITSAAGLSDFLPEGSFESEMCGTVTYMAPEIARCYHGFRHGRHDRRVDFWALGVYTHLLVLGYSP